MGKVKDFLLYRDLRRLDEFKTKYKILYLSFFMVTFVLLGILFGFNMGVLGAVFYGTIAGFIGKSLFFLTIRAIGKTKDIYYSDEYLKKINKSK